MSSQTDFIRAMGEPTVYFDHVDYVMANLYRDVQPDAPRGIYTIPARDPICPYCDMIVAGDVCRNCGARRKG